jgi:hypothetical protein
VCVCACVRVCVRACVRAGVCVCARARVRVCVTCHARTHLNESELDKRKDHAVSIHGLGSASSSLLLVGEQDIKTPQQLHAGVEVVATIKYYVVRDLLALSKSPCCSVNVSKLSSVGQSSLSFMLPKTLPTCIIINACTLDLPQRPKRPTSLEHAREDHPAQGCRCVFLNPEQRSQQSACERPILCTLEVAVVRGLGMHRLEC